LRANNNKLIILISIPNKILLGIIAKKEWEFRDDSEDGLSFYLMSFPYHFSEYLI
jgi:hypothetical protein